MLMSPVLGIALTPLWTMSAWFLLPIVLLAPPEVRVARLNAVGLDASGRNVGRSTTNR